MNDPSKIKLALVDDHILFRKGLRSLIEKINPQFSVLFEADNGLVMQQKLNSEMLPDVLLLDIDMPQMDGYESIIWLTEHFPSIKILVVSMIEDEASVVRILKLGVKGYLSKDVEPDVLHKAIMDIYHGHLYYTDFITGRLLEALNNMDQPKEGNRPWNINDREQEFIKLACSEMTYQQIAGEMFLSPKTIDGYRKSLFEKLNVKSRVGLVMFAIKHGLVEI